MSNIKIREASLKDIKTIQDLSQELFEHDAQWDKFFNMNWSHGQAGEKFFRKVLTAKNRTCFIAEADGIPVGYLDASVLPTPSWRPVKRTEITNLFIKEKFRSKGIGTKLIDRFLKWSRGKGVKRAVVVASAGNEKAVGFYRKNKFQPVFTTLETDL